MEEQSNFQNYQEGRSDVNMRLKDLEERQRLLKDRTLLIGKNLVDEREKNFTDMQQLKKDIMILKEESLRMREFIQRISEQIAKMARKEELMILQRQFDMLEVKK